MTTVTATEPTGRDLAHEIKRTMTRLGMNIDDVHTWSHIDTGQAAAAMVTWYGQALNIAGFDYCDKCGSEGLITEMVYPYDGADHCTCKHCPPYPKH